MARTSIVYDEKKIDFYNAAVRRKMGKRML